MARLTTNAWPTLSRAELVDPVIFVIDMVNGFVKEGALADSAIADIKPEIARLLDETDCANVFVCDAHPPKTREFEAYPPHCVIGTPESEVVDELADRIQRVIHKNSTNAFMAPEFTQWLDERLHHYKDIVITGCCTDLCVLQFALAMQTYFNEHNMTDKRVIVVADCVDTYNIKDSHPAVFWNEAALANMAANGITVVKNIEKEKEN